MLEWVKNIEDPRMAWILLQLELPLWTSERNVIDRVMTPKEVHALISGTCEYITLHGKGTLQM